MTLQGKPDRAKDDLEAYERKIESKKAIEKKIAGLEEEMRAAEKPIKQLKETKDTNTLSLDTASIEEAELSSYRGTPYERERLQLNPEH